ncbi:hypothetical protein OSTOST_05817, partial [Ostertagia ostertagi]
MGSKKYPYKGVLDVIANRCLASGTNAWTDQDHTAYTLSTASQFATEVHHINGKGEDAGVVYSEMQDHESEMSCIMDRRKEEGSFCTLQTTHIVSTRVDGYRALGRREHLAEVPASFQRPFVSLHLKPMAESSEHRVVCPSDDESRGSVEISWFMEKVVKEHLEDKTWDMERMGFLIGQSVKNELKKLELIRRLRSEPASFWSGLVKKYFTSPHVVVVGVPSEKMVEQVAKEEKTRLDKQRKELGKDGIKECGEKIQAAIKENTAKKPSAEVLNELIVRKLEEFDRFPVDMKSNRGGSPSSQPIAKFLDQFPFPATVRKLSPTKFVELFFLFDTSVLTVEQRAMLDVYTELLFESPAKINGVVKSAEEVSKLYTKDLVDHSIYVGVSGNFEKFGHRPTDFQEKVAFDVLFDYMSNTPVSPLQREFVLIEKPLASQVSFHVTEQTTCLIQLSFSGVPTKRLDDVSKKFMEKVVKEHLEDKTWDMERMDGKTSCNQLFGHMIGHQLYDENEDQLKTRMDEKYFTSPHVVVVGVPSEKMVEQVAKEEKTRLDKQRKELGKDGIKECGEKIQAAIKENTAKKPSAEVLNELIVRKLEEFDRFPVDMKSNRGGSPSSQPIAKFLDQFPFPATVHNCPTKFVELFFLFDTSVLTVEQRAMLGSKINGVVKSAEEVSKLYTKDLVDHSIYVGVSGNFEKLLHLRIVVDAETGFPNLAKWAEIFTVGVMFDIQRVKQCAKKLASDAREKKRDGCAVANSALSTLIYHPNTNGYMYDELIAWKFQTRICERILRLALFSHGVNAHLVCNVDLIDSKQFDPIQWSFAERFYGNAEKFKAKAGESIDTAFVGRQKVISVGGSESSFIYQLCMMDCDWMSDELVPTMLFTQYLSQCEASMVMNSGSDPSGQPCLPSRASQTREIPKRASYKSCLLESRAEFWGGKKIRWKYARAITVHPSKIAEVKSAFPGIEEATVASLNYVPPAS